VAVSPGPVITTFEYSPAPGVKINKVVNLSDDLALALRAISIRIVAPIPGKAVIGIEVPNINRAMVRFKEIVASTDFDKSNSYLPLCLGKDIVGNPVVAELDKMPHLLIAGATGTGKSVALNSMICSILYKSTPEEVKLIMVDPKRIELSSYNGIPHLITPVVVDAKKATNALFWAIREMERRYELLSQNNTRNVRQYNKKIENEKKSGTEGELEKLPYLVIVIDELADLMMLSPDETERGITRLAQMARATGIHMVIATQRPSVDVVTGLIKANFPARIAFAVASSTDSRVILDTTGAERLLGQGDMLFQSPDAAAPIRMQGCFVSEGELNKLIKYWQSAVRFSSVAAPSATAQPAGGGAPADPAETGEETSSDLPPAPQHPPVEEPVQQPLWEELQAQEEEAQKYEDELLPDAIALVRQLGKASTSLLQRRFRIGYTRAARMMDIMEEDGIIGPPTGTSKAREVLPWRDDKADLDGENGASQE
jgi:S-DNA-T family DNA segregation ATPase FtsK/SpoIIIE